MRKNCLSPDLSEVRIAGESRCARAQIINFRLLLGLQFRTRVYRTLRAGDSLITILQLSNS